MQYTFAGQPWLAALSNCATDAVIEPELRAIDYMNPGRVDMIIRIGEGSTDALPAYPIGSEDLLVILNPKNPIRPLSAEQASAIFSGQIRNWKDLHGPDAPIQVWAFSSDEEIQQIFIQFLLGEKRLTSLARQASSPEEMIQAVAADVHAIGILPRHWKTEAVSEALTVATVPVLIITPEEPQGAAAAAIACLQK